MFEVIGIQKKTYKFDDGRETSGKIFYLGETVDYVEGWKVERVFLSDDKLKVCDPVLGAAVDVRWNRYGKADCLELGSSK